VSGQKPEKEVVGRAMAIAVGIICTILATGLVVAIANYASIINDKDSIINDKDSIIDDKDNIINEKNNTISSLNSQISDLNDSNQYLQNQIDCLYNITNLKNRLFLGNGTIYPTEFANNTIDLREYSGYLTVLIATPTPNSATLRVISGTNYDQTIGIGTSTRIVIPVLRSFVSIIIEHATKEVTYAETLYY
jgi:hypothetical protein